MGQRRDTRGEITREVCRGKVWKQNGKTLSLGLTLESPALRFWADPTVHRPSFRRQRREWGLLLLGEWNRSTLSYSSCSAPSETLHPKYNKHKGALKGGEPQADWQGTLGPKEHYGGESRGVSFCLRFPGLGAEMPMVKTFFQKAPAQVCFLWPRG